MPRSCTALFVCAPEHLKTLDTEVSDARSSELRSGLCVGVHIQKPVSDRLMHCVCVALALAVYVTKHLKHSLLTQAVALEA
jgi:hypothetical protein